MSRISNIICAAKETTGTPAGRVILTGIANMAATAISSALIARFSPEKATFRRATKAGLYNVLYLTMVGAAMTKLAEDEAKAQVMRAEDRANNAQDELITARESLEHLRDQLTTLQMELEYVKTLDNSELKRRFLNDIAARAEELDTQVMMAQ